MDYRALHPLTNDPNAPPRARIAMTCPGYLNGNYLLELIAVDGPHSGRCLAKAEIPRRKTYGKIWAPLSAPRPSERRAREQLRVAAKQDGYEVVDY